MEMLSVYPNLPSFSLRATEDSWYAAWPFIILFIISFTMNIISFPMNSQYVRTTYAAKESKVLHTVTKMQQNATKKK